MVLESSINRGDTDMQPVLNAVATSGAELLFFPSMSPEGDLMIQQAQEIPSLQEIILMAEDALLSNTLMDALPEDPPNIYFASTTSVENSSTEKLAASYETTYGSTLIFSFSDFVYDAANLLFQAIEASAHQMSDGTLFVGRQAIREAVASTTDYQGLSGLLSCDSFGDCGNASFAIILMDETTTDLEAIRLNIIYTYQPER